MDKEKINFIIYAGSKIFQLIYNLWSIISPPIFDKAKNIILVGLPKTGKTVFTFTLAGGCLFEDDVRNEIYPWVFYLNYPENIDDEEREDYLNNIRERYKKYKEKTYERTVGKEEIKFELHWNFAPRKSIYNLWIFYFIHFSKRRKLF